jgi:hypothetical protein
MNDMYEKQCSLERLRLEMMSSMMQVNQQQNQQMVSLMTMLAQRHGTSFSRLGVVTVTTIVTKRTSTLCFGALV